MFVVHKTERPDGDTSFGPSVHEEPNETSPKQNAKFGHFAILQSDGDVEGEYVFVQVKPQWSNKNPIIGWMNRKYLSSEPVPVEELYADLNDFDEEFFVRTCVRAELAAASGGDAAENSVSAELLIALALLMSKLDTFSGRLDGTDAFGPFQFTSTKWQTFLADNPDIGLTAQDRISHYHQISGAAYYIQTLAKALLQQVKDINPDDKDYMPSFFDVCLAWLISPKAAQAIDAAHGGANPNQPVRPLIEANVTDFALAAKFCKLLIDVEDSSLSVDVFVQKIANELNLKLKMAFNKIKTHAKEYLVRPTAKASWLPKAETELGVWDPNSDGIPDFDEKSLQGIQETVKYFRAIYPGWPGGNPTPAWCGAFAAYCVKEAGLGDTIPNVAEGARNWRNWGNISIPTRADSYPKGSVIMTSKSANNRQVGHVAFYLQHLDGKQKIEYLGGNQGPLGQVTKSTIDVSRVVAVQWHGAANSIDDDEAMVVAMTIYGEARNESEAGQQAVASVILNRVKKGKKAYGLTAKEVCLKPWQFSCWNLNDPNRAKITSVANHATAKFKDCLGIAQSALGGTLEDNTDGATHYYANYIAKPSWLINNPNNPVQTAQYGVHLFYKSVDG